VHGWFTDDTPKRFEAYGWHVIPNVDGHDPEAVGRALDAARAEKTRPTMICAKTVIGWGAPNKQGTEAVHGAALGAEEVAAARRQLGWTHPPFVVPEDIRAAWDARERGTKREREWQDLFARYRREHPALGAEYERRMQGQLPEEYARASRDAVTKSIEAAASTATRQTSQAALNVLGPSLPELIGGSADLTGSNNTLRKDSRPVAPEHPDGNYVYYGVREFGMSAIMNGLTLHGGFIAYGGTFLTFSDYARNAVRMAALMKIGTIFVYTHDSIGLGEDGPTHQSIEHLAALRLVPGMSLWRPCDGVEAAVSWTEAIGRRDGPTSLVFTRQNVTFQARTPEQVQAIRRGGYVLIDSEGGAPDCIVIATGSEVGIAAEAVRELNKRGRRVRLVSMPSTDAFERQDAAWREAVLPVSVDRRVAIEAGVSNYWWQYVGPRGRVIGIDRFGASGKAPELFRHFGFTSARIIETVEELLSRRS
jgi:transketolase